MISIVVGVSLIPTILTTIDALPTSTPAGLSALVNVLPYVFVAVGSKEFGCSGEQSPLKHALNSVKPKAFCYGNTEASLSNQEAVETKQGASHVDEDIVQSPTKVEKRRILLGAVASNLSGPLQSNLYRITGLIRGKLRAFAYANPELSSKSFGFDKCVETIHPASAICGW